MPPKKATTESSAAAAAEAPAVGLRTAPIASQGERKRTGASTGDIEEQSRKRARKALDTKDNDQKQEGSSLESKDDKSWIPSPPESTTYPANEALDNKVSSWDRIQEHLSENKRLRECGGDGDCGPRVVAYHAFGDARHHGIVRALIAEALKLDDLSWALPFIPADNANILTTFLRTHVADDEVKYREAASTRVRSYLNYGSSTWREAVTRIGSPGIFLGSMEMAIGCAVLGIPLDVWTCFPLTNEIYHQSFPFLALPVALNGIAARFGITRASAAPIPRLEMAMAISHFKVVCIAPSTRTAQSDSDHSDPPPAPRVVPFSLGSRSLSSTLVPSSAAAQAVASSESSAAEEKDKADFKTYWTLLHDGRVPTDAELAKFLQEQYDGDSRARARQKPTLELHAKLYKILNDAVRDHQLADLHTHLMGNQDHNFWIGEMKRIRALVDEQIDGLKRIDESNDDKKDERRAKRSKEHESKEMLLKLQHVELYGPLAATQPRSAEDPAKFWQLIREDIERERKSDGKGEDKGGEGGEGGGPRGSDIKPLGYGSADLMRDRLRPELVLRIWQKLADNTNRLAGPEYRDAPISDALRDYLHKNFVTPHELNLMFTPDVVFDLKEHLIPALLLGKPESQFNETMLKNVLYPKWKQDEEKWAEKVKEYIVFDARAQVFTFRLGISNTDLLWFMTLASVETAVAESITMNATKALNGVYRGGFTPQFFPRRFLLRDAISSQYLSVIDSLLNASLGRYYTNGVKYVEYSVSINDIAKRPWFYRHLVKPKDLDDDASKVAFNYLAGFNRNDLLWPSLGVDKHGEPEHQMKHLSHKQVRAFIEQKPKHWVHDVVWGDRQVVNDRFANMIKAHEQFKDALEGSVQEYGGVAPKCNNKQIQSSVCIAHRVVGYDLMSEECGYPYSPFSIGDFATMPSRIWQLVGRTFGFRIHAGECLHGSATSDSQITAAYVKHVDVTWRGIMALLGPSQIGLEKHEQAKLCPIRIGHGVAIASSQCDPRADGADGDGIHCYWSRDERMKDLWRSKAPIEVNLSSNHILAADYGGAEDEEHMAKQLFADQQDQKHVAPIVLGTDDDGIFPLIPCKCSGRKHESVAGEFCLAIRRGFFTTEALLQATITAGYDCRFGQKMRPRDAVDLDPEEGEHDHPYLRAYTATRE